VRIVFLFGKPDRAGLRDPDPADEVPPAGRSVRGWREPPRGRRSASGGQSAAVIPRLAVQRDRGFDASGEDRLPRCVAGRLQEAAVRRVPLPSSACRCTQGARSAFLRFAARQGAQARLPARVFALSPAPAARPRGARARFGAEARAYAGQCCSAVSPRLYSDMSASRKASPKLLYLVGYIQQYRLSRGRGCDHAGCIWSLTQPDSRALYGR